MRRGTGVGGGWKKHHASTIITANSSTAKPRHATPCKHNPVAISKDRTNERTNERTNGRTDGRTHIQIKQNKPNKAKHNTYQNQWSFSLHVHFVYVCSSWDWVGQKSSRYWDGSKTNKQTNIQTNKRNQTNKVPTRINKEWEVTALEQLTSHIERRPTTTETRVAYDNSTWHAINTGYINSTKETSQTNKQTKHPLELVNCFRGTRSFLVFSREYVYMPVQLNIWDGII